MVPVTRASTKRGRDPVLTFWALTPLAIFALLGCTATDAPGTEVGTQAQDIQELAGSGLDRALATEPFHRLISLSFTSDPSEGALLSQIVADGRPFDEAIPSWNVTGTRPFAVDVRVQGSEGWSPWLRIGDWNLASRTGEERTQFESGKVAVDVLRLTSPSQSAQIALRAMDEGAPLAPSAVQAFMTLTDRDQLGARVASAISEPWPAAHLIEVPPRSQREDGGEIGGRICSPTSVAMVVDYHGADVPTTQMAATIHDPHFEIYGNWNRAVQGAFSHGVPGRIARFSSWSTVREVLATGRPIVASIRAAEGEISGAPYTKTAGHLLVITGLHASDAVHVNDPAAKTAAGVKRLYLRSEMERVWFEKGGVAYVLGEDSAPLIQPGSANAPLHGAPGK